MSNDKRTRNFMGVVYNFNDASHHHNFNGKSNYFEMLDSFLQSPNIKYYTHGEEECPTSGTPHLQCFLILKNMMSIRALRKLWLEIVGIECTMSFTPADGNIDECIKYAQKDNKNVFEHGERPKGKGFRSDIDAVINDVKNGATLKEIALNHPQIYIKQAAGLQNWMTMIAPIRNFKTEVYWIYGPTGVGKSRWVFDQVPPETIYMKSSGNKWWCHYAQQKNILWDDFRPHKEIPFEYLLRLFDRFPMMVEGKGTQINFAPERIFITTPKDPQETFAHWEFLGAECLNQLSRRITRVIHIPTIESARFVAPLENYVKEINNYEKS